MHYPSFPKPGDTISICAPSAGVGGKAESFDASLAVLHDQGYRTKETASVRTDGPRSTDGKTRAEELVSCFMDPDSAMVMCASGGDFMYEIHPHVDFEAIKAHPKWIAGMSDPTHILYPLLTKYDMPGFYGYNAGAYDRGIDFPLVRENLELLKGNLVTQYSQEFHDPRLPWEVDEPDMTTPIRWLSNRDAFTVTGRCIGGCVEVIKDLMGTPLDGTADFLDRYEEDGVIWFFDDFALSSEAFYMTLLQMKLAGYFRTAKAVVLGRPLIRSNTTGMTYEEALERALGDLDLPYIHEADVGHTDPRMTLILGAVCTLDYADEKGSIRFELK